MIKIPERLSLANLPTKIEKLERLSDALEGPNIYIKRDDQTGTELSGNKIRKLEFTIKEALDQGCDYLITCGGSQSNHCRATAAAAAKLGLKACLLLRTNEYAELDGNLFLDNLLGADVRFISSEDYKNHNTIRMQEIKAELEKKGHKPYIIPQGASHGIGSFGYYMAMEEILYQEKELGVHFDAVVLAVGSGGTYAGLFLANKALNNDAQVFGINVCDDADIFKVRIYDILEESMGYLEEKVHFSKEELNIIDGYVGRGYAISRPEELKLIYELARMEGVILDPVYTGKAMYGLIKEIKKGSFKNYKNLLFIHTGGLFGVFPQKNLFNF